MWGNRRYPGDVTRPILRPRCRAGSQPAAFLSDTQRLGPVAGAGLLDAGGQVVPHRPLRQVQRHRDLGDRGAVLARREDVSFARGQRAGALGQRGGGQLRVDDPLPTEHLPDRPGEPVRRGVLDHEARGAGLHRASQVAGAPERGEDDDLGGGAGLAERRGGGEAVHAGHLYVEQRDVRLAGQRRRRHLVATAYLGDDLDVVLERQQRRQGLADHLLVFGDQHPDGSHVVTVTPAAAETTGAIGTVATRQKPCALGRSSRPPPTAHSRSDIPCRPVPAPAWISAGRSGSAASSPGHPRPSSRTWSESVCVSSWRMRRMEQFFAPEWRITFVTASRRHQASAASASGLNVPDSSVSSGSSCGAIPALSRAVRAVIVSTASVGRRYPLIASRMSCRVCRLTAATCWISSATRSLSGPSGSRSSSRAATSDLSVIMDSDWPVRSCMSLASRSRSSLAACFATSSRAWRNSHISFICTRKPDIVMPTNTTGISVITMSEMSSWPSQPKKR